MDDQVRARMGEVVAACARELFGAFGVPLADAGDAGDAGAVIPGEATMAIIGFAGEQMRGSLAVYAPNVVFARSYQGVAGSPPAGEGDVQGWAAELSNLLLGRIKRELIGYGVVLQVCTPTAFGGRELEVNAEPANDCLARCFGADGAPVLVLFRALTGPAFELAPLSEAPPLASEGEPMFF